MHAPVPPIPLSRPVVVAALPSGGRDIRVEATPAECVAIAQAFRLAAVKSLVAQFLARPSGAAVRVTGPVEGVVTQICTVSLEQFDATVSEEVDLTFMPEAGLAAWMAEHRPDPAADLAYESDPPDVIHDGRIDLGAVAAEFLALGLDPYPRKPGISFEPASDRADRDPSPFAALARLKSGD